MSSVITGTGIAAPGVVTVARLLDAEPAPAESPFDVAAVVGRKGLRYKDEATRLALAAACLALRDAGLPPDSAGPDVLGDSAAVVVSSNLGNLDTVVAAAGTIAEHGVTGLSPMDLPNASCNVIPSSVAIWFGMRGANLMLCNGASSGLDAVHWASVLVDAGRAARVVVVGVEVDNVVVRSLVGSENLFHGAVALVVEDAAAAARRGAPALAVPSGYRRAADPVASSSAVGAFGRPGLWLVPQGYTGPVPPFLRDTPTHDLSAVVGRASGALGVLQCAAAVSRLSAGQLTPVLSTAGGDADDGSASLLLSPPPSVPSPADQLTPSLAVAENTGAQPR
jgi:3-oxoacyl-[acyl-carrier-protein] synthase II